jgi:hypothetical protein
MSVKQMLDCARQFNLRFGISPTQKMREQRSEILIETGRAGLEISDRLEMLVSDSDLRFLRGHLCIEEPAEMLLAMGEGDEVKAFDGLLDSLYVLLGTAVTFDWPVDEGFAEVHQSNMTKIRKGDDPGRVRDKGLEFRPPQLAQLLERYRDGKLSRRRPMNVPDGMDAISREDQELVQAAVHALTWSAATRQLALEMLQDLKKQTEKEKR